MNKFIIKLLSSGIIEDLDIAISTLKTEEDLFNFLWLSNSVFYYTACLDGYSEIIYKLSVKFNVHMSEIIKIDSLIQDILYSDDLIKPNKLNGFDPICSSETIINEMCYE